MKKNKIKLAIAPIGWSNDDLPELGGHISFEQCISEMAIAGYQGCEVGHKFPRDPLILSHALSKYNLQVASAWYSLYFTEVARVQETINGFIAHMNFLKVLGAKVIVVCECGHSIQGKSVAVFKNKPIFSDQQWKLLMDGLVCIAQLAKENSMDIVYHHHMGTGVQQLDEINFLMAETKDIYLLLDTGHLTYANVDPLSVIVQQGKRIKHVHLKDIRKDILREVHNNQLSFLDSVKAGVFTVPGDGCIDFIPIMNLLFSLNYQGWMVVEAEQDPDKANPLRYARMAKDYLSQFVMP